MTGVCLPKHLPPVMLLGDKFGYPSGVSHGLTTYYLNVVPHLSREVDLTVCLLREPHPAARELNSAGIEPVFFSARRWNPFVVLQVAALAKQRGCRIIHAGGIKAALVARAVARLLDASVLVHVHDEKIPPASIRFLHRMFARPTDLGICVSRAVSENAHGSYYLARNRLRIVHNGVELERFRQIAPDARHRVRAELDIPSNARVLALIGRFYVLKGHEEMIRMMCAIATRCPDVVLILAGDGPDRLACESLAAQLGVKSHLRFLGQRNDVAALLEASDLVVMPSHTEGFPLAVVEALAIGRPVVGYDVGGIGEAIDCGQTGRLVPARNMDAFVDAVVSLLEDRATLAAYSKRAFAAAEKYSSSAHVASLLECYEEVAGVTAAS